MSIFAGWLYGTGVVLAVNVQAVRLYFCLCAWMWSVDWLLVFDEVWGRKLTLMRHVGVRIYYNCCVCVRACAWRIYYNCFACVCVCVRVCARVCVLCLNLEVWINCWCLMKCEVARRKLIYIVVSINTLQWRWRLYLRWIYHGTGIALALDKQEVRLHYCRVRVHLPSMMLLMLSDASHYEVVIISPSYTVAPIHYYNGGDV